MFRLSSGQMSWSWSLVEIFKLNFGWACEAELLSLFWSWSIGQAWLIFWSRMFEETEMLPRLIKEMTSAITLVKTPKPWVRTRPLAMFGEKNLLLHTTEFKFWRLAEALVVPRWRSIITIARWTRVIGWRQIVNYRIMGMLDTGYCWSNCFQIQVQVQIAM